MIAALDPIPNPQGVLAALRSVHLVGTGRLGDEAASVEVDEQPWRRRLLLQPGQAGRGDGRHVTRGKPQQLLAVLKYDRSAALLQQGEKQIFIMSDIKTVSSLVFGKIAFELSVF